ncbi:Pyruvate dehydrogenase E1 component subunit alpha mitochondrial [Fasciola hepatica]|uniref:Pyruvate dehydrogenase E1 component subunit alpha n=1 Tax=Fasciola hepatica TaxID=6192 RepID=A0A4E0R790_FASHE|nr:Pyruvate dehydrogenase E1 component subunit alpha mitochondrial [Fasciola hepatica]
MLQSGRHFASSSSFFRTILNSVLPRFQSTVQSAQFDLTEYKLFKLDSPPSNRTECTRDDALLYLNELLRIRRMETTAGNMYKEKQIRGFCHLSSGQEAVAVGIEAALSPGDTIVTAYRCHGFTMTRGVAVHSILAELAGKRTGVSAGKGGSMHMFGKDFFGGNGIVGAQVPLGVGIALRMKHHGDRTVSVTLFGDGAANQGQVFEAFNMAKLWNLPVVFVCENNKYGMGTAVHRASANTDYYTRGDYIPGIWVDGMDVLTVREATRFAREWCLSGKGPILIEAETYRYHGHSMSDPGTSYRTREEVQSVRRGRDPISLFQKRVTEAQLCSDEEIKAMEKKVREEVDKDAEQSLGDPEPALESVYEHVYQHLLPGFKVRGCDLYTWGTPKV